MDDPRYTVDKWHGYDNYNCVRCQYSTLWLAKMLKHFTKKRHPWAYPVDPEKIEEGPKQAKY